MTRKVNFNVNPSNGHHLRGFANDNAPASSMAANPRFLDANISATTILRERIVITR